MPNLEKLSRDTAIYGLGAGLKKVIGLFLLPFYTRALSPAEYGILDTLATVSFFTTVILGLGLTGATGRYFFIAKDYKEKGSVLYTSIVLRIISTTIPCVLLIFFADRISNTLFNTDQYSWVVIITLLVIPIQSISQLQDLLFRYYREPWKYILVSIIRAIVNPISGIILVFILQWGVFGATLSSLISSIIVLLFAYFYYTRKKYIREFSPYWAKKMLKFGFPLIFTGILGWINAVSDRLFLLHYTNLDQIGLYSIGITFSQPISFLNLALTLSSTVLVMSLFSEETDKDKPQTKKFLTQIWYFYFVISIPIALLISIFSSEIVNFVSTPKYILSVLAIPFLMFSMILTQSAQITGNGMTLKEKSKPYFWIMLIAASFNVILNFYFIPKFGFVGAAFTTVTSNLVYFIFAYFWSQKYFYIKRSIIKPMLYFFIAFGIALFFPFAQLKYEVLIPLWSKFVIFSFTLSLPFIFGLTDMGMLKTVFRRLKTKFS